jgi:hypothetical protein
VPKQLENDEKTVCLDPADEEKRYHVNHVNHVDVNDLEDPVQAAQSARDWKEDADCSHDRNENGAHYDD